ncbi:MAG: hypothetical protein IPL98_07585 [Saprospiraceae bacterium]|nr:hypothetical protein [Saprospiraceae bacterium]
MTSIISLLSPTQDLQFTRQGKFGYDDFIKQEMRLRKIAQMIYFLNMKQE